MLRLKKCSNFRIFFLNRNWGCSKCVQIALFVYWNNSDFLCLFLAGCLISRIFYNHCFICVLKVAEVALYRFWTYLRIMLSTISVQDLKRAAPAKFRTQIEQFRTHFEQPQITVCAVKHGRSEEKSF